MAEEEKTESSSALTVGELRNMIADTVKSIVGGGDDKKEDEKKTEPTSGGSRPEGGGIAAEVARQVEKIRAREAREKRDSEIDGKLKELSEKVQEKPPVERRKVHRIMGWGD